MGTPTAHQWQRAFCETATRPILNAASKEDPARLGSGYGATNLDICDFDIHTGIHLNTIPNFVRGSITDIGTLFPAHHFNTVVLGEFIEHCLVDYAEEVLERIHAALPVGGVLALTFPLDGRPPEVQHGKDQLKVLVGDESNPRFTTYHQTVWTGEMLSKLFGEKWIVGRQEELHYGFCGPGWGIVLRRI